MVTADRDGGLLDRVRNGEWLDAQVFPPLSWVAPWAGDRGLRAGGGSTEAWEVDGSFWGLGLAGGLWWTPPSGGYRCRPDRCCTRPSRMVIVGCSLGPGRS